MGSDGLDLSAIDGVVLVVVVEGGEVAAREIVHVETAVVAYVKLGGVEGVDRGSLLIAMGCLDGRVAGGTGDEAPACSAVGRDVGTYAAKIDRLRIARRHGESQVIVGLTVGSDGGAVAVNGGPA